MSRRVVFASHAHRAVQRGIRAVVSAVRPTLGPRPRLVAADSGIAGRPPEWLDQGSVVARRIVALPDRDADVGAMLARGLLWRLHEEVGDGTATAAVLLQAVFDEGLRYLSSGGNGSRLRVHLERGGQIVAAELAARSQPVSGRAHLTRLAKTLSGDAAVADILGEVFDEVGEYGQVDIRAGQGRGIQREYVEGAYWPGCVLAHQMLAGNGHKRVHLKDVAILITDLQLTDPIDLALPLQFSAQAKAAALLIVAASASDKILAPLLAAQKASKVRVVAVRVPGSTEEAQAAAMKDLGVLTGGSPIVQAAGMSMKHLRPDDLGRARRAWVDALLFGIDAGYGDPIRLRQHIRQLEAAAANAISAKTKQELLVRLGRLQSRSVTVWVGGATELEIKLRKAIAERCAAALKLALVGGVLPGGGIALLASIKALARRAKEARDEEERVALKILERALEAPFRSLLANAGYDPGTVLADIQRQGEGYGFDVCAGRVVNLTEAGIWDVAPAISAAVVGAIRTAALALTLDVLVHPRKPDVSITP